MPSHWCDKSTDPVSVVCASLSCSIMTHHPRNAVPPDHCAPSPCMRCALQAAGYRVIEVNPSINRAGVQVQRLVGEATQSQRVALPPLMAADAGAVGNDSPDDGGAAAADVPRSKPAREAPASSFFRPQKAAVHAGKQPGGASTQPSKGGGGENGSKVDSRDVELQKPATDVSTAATEAQAQAQGSSQPPPLTLLLFEEVDNLQEEDRGFISTLQELLACSKVRSVENNLVCLQASSSWPSVAGSPGDHAVCTQCISCSFWCWQWTIHAWYVRLLACISLCHPCLQCPIIMTSNHSSPGGMLSGMRARSISFPRPSATQVHGSNA
jgi:hypothetical protein